MRRLLRRQDFLFVRDGRRANAATLTLQARPRPEAGGGARVGFTVTKKTGGAVERNRIRRRLREAVRLIGALHVRDGHDYVVIGRPPALEAPFASILSDLAAACGRVHAERRDARGALRGADEAMR